MQNTSETSGEDQHWKLLHIMTLLSSWEARGLSTGGHTDGDGG